MLCSMFFHSYFSQRALPGIAEEEEEEEES
jgi:hypothetical protein